MRASKHVIDAIFLCALISAVLGTFVLCCVDGSPSYMLMMVILTGICYGGLLIWTGVVVGLAAAHLSEKIAIRFNLRNCWHRAAFHLAAFSYTGIATYFVISSFLGTGVGVAAFVTSTFFFVFGYLSDR